MKPQNPEPGKWKLLRIWTGIGLQSFGGGASTTYLIYQSFVEKYNWLLPEEYILYSNLSVMAPGINILALTILIGRKLGGVLGIVTSLTGLLLPSSTITCLLTAGFLSVERFPATQAMLQGAVPATAGLLLVVGLKYARPLFKESRTEDFPRLIMSLFVILAGFLALTLVHIPVLLVLAGSALLGVIMFTRPAPRAVTSETDQARLAQKAGSEKEEIHD